MNIQKFIDKGVKRLHLGCGSQYMEGYINIDNSTREDVITDLRCDFTLLQLPHESLTEIRLHNVFEHFQRHIAIGLICEWNEALTYQGTLTIEVPDIDDCIIEFMETADLNRKKEIIRHMWGSHKEGWATHHEGWTINNLEEIFQACGFGNLTVNKKRRKWSDVEVSGKKIQKPSLENILSFLKPFDANNNILMPIWEKYFRNKFNQ